MGELVSQEDVEKAIEAYGEKCGKHPWF